MDARDDIPRGLRLDELGGVEIVVGRFRDHRFPRHSHEGLMLSLIDDGLQRVRYRGADHLGGRGAVIAIPPEEVHEGAPDDAEGWRYRTITVPTAQVSALAGGRSARFACATLIEDRRLARALAGLFDRFGAAPRLAQESALMATLNLFMNRYARAVAPPPNVGAEARATARAKALLAARLDETVSLDDLAAAAGVDKYRLARAFRRIEGLPPHAWHVQYRVRRAQELLSRGAAVADAAYATGFADQAHLTRAFRRLTGLTPGRYRRLHLDRARR